MMTPISRAVRYTGLIGLMLLFAFVSRPSWTGASRPSSSPAYTLTELGALSGGGASAARAVSPSGEATGYASTASGPRAFVWDRSAGMRSLGTLSGDTRSYGTGINASGEVCGTSIGPGGPRAFVSTRTGGMRALLPLATGATSMAYGINAAGQVAGVSDYRDRLGTRCFGAVLWDPSGNAQLLPVLDTRQASRPAAAVAINDAGQVTGYQPITDVVRGRSYVRDQPFVWDAETGMKLLSRPSGSGGRPLANNLSGEVLGLAQSGANPAGYPVSWASKSDRILDGINHLSGTGPFEEQLGGINSRGQIVYSLSSRKPGASVATLFQHGSAADLNEMISNLAPVHLYTAAAINDRGQIVGAMVDRRGARSRAYLLTPTETITPGAPQLPVDLGTAGNFTILAKSGISTTGTTSIFGDIGVSPISSTAITGFGLILDGSGQFSTTPIVTGKVYAAEYANPTPSMLTTAVGDMETAYTNAAGRTLPDFIEHGSGNLSGLTLVPGLYKWSTGVIIPDNVTLAGSSSDIWVFQIAGTLDISSGKQVMLSGGAQPKNIFWQVAGQVTLGTTSVFNGIILAQTGIAALTGATLNGRALAQTAVTLDSVTFDGIAPTITCPIEVTTNTDLGLCTASSVPLGTPATTGVGVVVTNNAPSVYPLGLTLVTWTATDAIGRIATCQQRVTVRDVEAPVVTCPPNVTVPADQGESFASGVALGSPGVTDNCPGSGFLGTRSDSLLLTAPYPVGTTTVTWTATDAAGNTASCPQLVTVLANPTIVCPIDVTVNTDPALCTASNVALGTPTTTGTGVEVTNNAPSIYPLGLTLVTWTATDDFNRTATCQQRVTVRDTEAPVVACPPNLTVPADQGEVFATGVVLGTPTVTDNCPGVTFAGARSDSQLLSAAYPVGDTTVTWTATDAAGNTASCPQLVTVLANPTIVCPIDVTVNTDPGVCTASNVALGTPTTTGTGVEVTNNAPSIYPLGLTLVTWTATDDFSRTATCQQRVTVRDAEAPVVTCPPNLTVPADLGEAFATGVVLGTPTVTDNCPGVTFAGTRSMQPLNAPYPVGDTTVTWTATDAAGNTASCPQIVTVTAGPVITCPAEVFVATDPASCTATSVPLGTPTTAGSGVVVTNDAPSVFPLGLTVVTWTATDVLSRTATCQQRVTVRDLEAPSVTCPVNRTVPADLGESFASGVILGTPTVLDNCPSPTFAGTRSDSQPLTAAYPLGTTTVTWTATDAAGNVSSCPQLVIVTSAPTIQCPPDLTVNTDPAQCTATGVQLGTATATGVGIVLSNNAPSVFPLGLTVVTWTATDAVSQTATCQQRVTVRDVELPVITCAPNVTVPADQGEMFASGVQLGASSATDNCPSPGIAGTRSDGQPLTSPYPVGLTTVTWTATDGSGNSASCPQTVTVTPNPTIVCPADVTTNTDPSVCTAGNVQLGTPTTTGTGVIVTNNAPSIYPVGLTLVTWTATDVNGRTATCQQRVTVVDAEPPRVTGSRSFSRQTLLKGPIRISYRPPVGTDNCAVVSLVCSPPSGAYFKVGRTRVTCTATDAAGNNATYVFVVTLVRCR